jgi:hypothetical protein
VAASLNVRLLTSLPKNSRAASATPCTANDPRCPRYTSLRYISEDLVLRRLALENDRHVLLGELALERLLGREEEVLDELLCERAAADEILLLATQVRDDSADRPDDIHAGVVVEPAVLDGQHSLNHADGIAESGTCRRFSRPVLMSAVRSGGSSVTRSKRDSATVRPAMRATGAGAARGGAEASGFGVSNVARTMAPL